MNWFQKSEKEWILGPFRRFADNPIFCPRSVPWKLKNVYNPTAFVLNDTIYLIFRAQTRDMISFLGLSTSNDGINFDISSKPLLVPFENYEKQGCEDPRITHIEDEFLLTYTGYDGDQARLCLAKSKDLHNWHKYGPIITDQKWSKAGYILPYKVRGKYWMYYGDNGIWLAYSDDSIRWRTAVKLLKPRSNKFDSDVLEVGYAVITSHGIVMIINGADSSNVYRMGQVLFDKEKPWKVLSRMDNHFLCPMELEERSGETNNVVFGEGLIRFGGRWLLYYGAADRHINLAIA